jgi:DNA polymerase-3 subunit chi
MTEIRFYHLTRKSLEDALPELLEKCWQRRWRTVVMTGSEERIEALNRQLWTYKERSFLPHGSAKDGAPERQPIWLTDTDENPNNATVLFLTDGAGSEHVGDFTLVCEMFDGNDQEAVQAARDHWRRYRSDGHALTYYQQSASGRWEEKQRAEPKPGEG